MDSQDKTALIRTRLIGLRGRFPEVARISGLSLSYISKFACGKKSNPTIKSLDSLEQAMARMESVSEAEKAA